MLRVVGKWKRRIQVKKVFREKASVGEKNRRHLRMFRQNPGMKRRAPSEKKYKPHLFDETIKLNDLYYSFNQEQLEAIL